MSAHKDVKRFDQGSDAWPVLAAVCLRIAAWADRAVARWLARCARNAEAAQWLFETDEAPARGSRTGGSWSMPASAR